MKSPLRFRHGVHPPEHKEATAAADAIFLGAIGLPAVRHEDGTEIAPHLRLREPFQLYAGVRPVRRRTRLGHLVRRRLPITRRRVAAAGRRTAPRRSSNPMASDRA